MKEFGYLTDEELAQDTIELRNFMERDKRNDHLFNRPDKPLPIEEVKPVARISFKTGEDGILRNEMGETLQHYLARQDRIVPSDPSINQLSNRTHKRGSQE